VVLREQGTGNREQGMGNNKQGNVLTIVVTAISGFVIRIYLPFFNSIQVLGGNN
jgi:hypothetical protein